jgi:hypothetical protein
MCYRLENILIFSIENSITLVASKMAAHPLKLLRPPAPGKEKGICLRPMSPW